jgi:hypothetical protein
MLLFYRKNARSAMIHYSHILPQGPTKFFKVSYILPSNMLTTHRNNAKHIPDLNLSGLFQTMPIIFIGSCVKGHYSGTLTNPKYTLNQDADFIATQFQHNEPQPYTSLC